MAGLTPRAVAGWVALNAGLALAYALGAKLGPLASVGSGGGSVIWPASGLALAGLMIWGWRALPGLCLGSFLMNWLDYLLPLTGDPGRAALGSLGVSAASMLQAGLAAWMLRDLPQRMAQAPTRETLRFIAWVLAACLAGLVLSLSSRQLVGLLRPERLVDSALAWWLGDAAGMLVFTPPLLLWLHPRTRRDPVASLAFPILCMGVGLTLIAAYMLAHLERQAGRDRFRNDARSFALTLQNNLDLAERDLEVLRALFNKVEIDRAEFAATARPLLQRTPWALHYAWLPRVSADQRGHFERELALARGGPGGIRERTAGRPSVPAPVRAEHYPLLWVEPEAAGNPFVGVDEAADPARRTALAQAAGRVPVVSTGPLQAEAPGSPQRVVMELYARVDPLTERVGQQPGLRPATTGLGPARGVVATVIDLAALIQAAGRSMDGAAWRWLLHDPAAPALAGVGWDGRALSAWSAQQDGPLPRDLTRGLHERRVIQVGGRAWELLVQPAWGGQWPAWRRLQPVALVVGLGFTGLLAGFMVMRRRRDLMMQAARSDLEQQVTDRTQALAEANAHLRSEVEVRRRAEQDLRVFRWFAESAGQGLGIATFDHQVVYMNPQLRRALADPDWQPGVARDFIRSYYPPQHQRRLQEVVLPALLREGHWRGEVEGTRPGGHGPRWVQENYFALKDDAGEPLYVACVLTDITERRELEQRLRDASARADAASRAKSLFLANMSHEIRTPLNAVIGYAQLLREDRQLGTQVHARLGTILDAGHRLLRLINDVLDLSKIEAGSLQLRSDTFDLREELDKLAALVLPRARAKGLLMGVELDLPVGELVLGDRDKFGQVVLNLLGNAVKFADQGRVLLRALRDGERVRVVVVDEGPGIDAAEQAQLFDAFRQGQSGRDKGGTGLGLVLARRYAEAMGGSLGITSQPGQGTCVDVLLALPRVLPATVAGRAADPVPAEGMAQSVERLDPATPRRVLVVDDDPASRELLRLALSRIDCSVVAAEDGEAGLACALAERFDLILADIRMPRLDGLQMLQRLRATPGARPVPVVAVSASSLAHERRRYIAQGFDDFIGKPYVFEQIYAALARITGARFVHARPVPACPLDELLERSVDDDGLDARGVALRQALQSLAAAAAAGDPAGVQGALGQLAPPVLPASRHDALRQVAQAYDFEHLEALAKAFSMPDTVAAASAPTAPCETVSSPDAP